MVGSKYMSKIVAKNKTVHLPKLQSFASSLDEVGQFMKDAAEHLSEADHNRLEAWIAKNPDDVYAAKEYLKDPESLRAWLDKIYKTGGRSARRKGKGT
jgi:cytochrome c553